MGTTPEIKLPSFAQMRCRLDWAHKSVLNLFIGEEQVSACFINDYPVSRNTLRRWECIEIIPGERDLKRDLPLYRLTERGRAFLASFNERGAA